jgi:divalent metal cation (Fe/Co/Zn/Cd) transporter
MTTNAQNLHRQALYLEYLTVVWCIMEAGVSIWLGVASHSIALVGFGLDSVIEVFAALVVVWQLKGLNEQRERRALRLIAVTFFLLAAYIVVESVRDLILRVEAQKSVVAIVVMATALVIMLLLAWRKRRIGKESGNIVLLTEAKESALCALLAVATLIGLVLNAAMGWWWADPVAAIVIAVLALKEGREAWEGRECAECRHEGCAG